MNPKLIQISTTIIGLIRDNLANFPPVTANVSEFTQTGS